MIRSQMIAEFGLQCRVQKSIILDVEVCTSRSPDLRRKIATAVAVAQLSLVRTLLMRKLIHRCQTQALHGVSPNPHAAIDTVVEGNQ